MKKNLLFILVSVLTIGHLLAQSEQVSPCSSENHSAFDFWIGDWTVYNTSGEIIGTNKVLKMQGGCVLQENWEASNHSNTGTSYNYFDTSDNSWNQVWISNTGNVLNLKGNITKEGVMMLKSELEEGEKGQYYNQISWSKNKDGSVTQRWDILNKKGEIISKAFEGIYKKTTND